MFGLDPAVDGVLNVEHRTGMGATPDRTERNPQGVGDGVREATIGAGSHIQKMKAALQQERVEFIGGSTT